MSLKERLIHGDILETNGILVPDNFENAVNQQKRIAVRE
jgi:hypothetical protein